jgi:hypothetical protein
VESIGWVLEKEFWRAIPEQRHFVFREGIGVMRENGIVKVGDLQKASFLDHDVFGGEIVMDDPVGVEAIAGAEKLIGIGAD